VAALLACGAPAAHAAPSWLPPTALAAELGGNPPAATVAVAPDGTAVAAWSRDAGDVPAVEAARRRPGQGWSAPVRLTAEDRRGVAPQVGIDAAGNATVTWAELPGGPVRAARLLAASEVFEGAETLSAGLDARGPAIGVGPDGTTVVVFAEGPSSARVLRAAIRVAGADAFSGAATMSGPFRGFYQASDARPVAEVAVDPAGGAVAVWAGFDGTRHVVQTNERGPADAFGSTGQTRSSTAAGASGTDPAVVVDAGGNATVAWTHDPDVGNTADATQIHWSERLAGGGFSDPFPADPPGVAAGPAEAPDLAALPDRTVVAVWARGAGGDRRVETAFRLSGFGFSGLRELSGPGGLARPSVDAGGGTALVTWADPSADRILSVRRTRAGAFEAVQPAATRVDQPAGSIRDFGAPDVALDDEGNATAVWSIVDHRGSADVLGVQAAGFDAAAPTLSSFSVGGPTGVLRPVAMSAAAFDRWTAIGYAWSFGDDEFAAGPAVSHAYELGGTYTVALTVADAVGNAVVAVRELVVRPALRVRSRVTARWVVRRRVVLLRRLQVRRPPRGTVVRLRCAGARCPVDGVAVRRVRRGRIDVAAALRPRQRRFSAGQVVTLRIAAPRRIGKVVRYRLRRGRPPRVQRLCVPLGATTPQRRCPARAEAATGRRARVQAAVRDAVRRADRAPSGRPFLESSRRPTANSSRRPTGDASRRSTGDSMGRPAGPAAARPTGGSSLRPSRRAAGRH
jgi:hypothetical protein